MLFNLCHSNDAARTTLSQIDKEFEKAEQEKILQHEKEQRLMAEEKKRSEQVSKRPTHTSAKCVVSSTFINHHALPKCDV